MGKIFIRTFSASIQFKLIYTHNSGSWKDTRVAEESKEHQIPHTMVPGTESGMLPPISYLFMALLSATIDKVLRHVGKNVLTLYQIKNLRKEGASGCLDGTVS